jgi:hypothetical protein
MKLIVTEKYEKLYLDLPKEIKKTIQKKIKSLL